MLTPIRNFWYLMSPYTLYPFGLAQAVHDAILHGNKLIEAGYEVFVPVAHSYPMEQAAGGSIPWSRWMDVDLAIVDHAFGGIRLELGSWGASKGMAQEEARFIELGRPVVPWKPWTDPPRAALEQALAMWKVEAMEAAKLRQPAPSQTSKTHRPSRPKTPQPL